MASINVTNVVVLDNPTAFTNPFQFEITFECLRNLSSDLEWKLTYVGSADSEENDQELDSVLVGPVPLGINRFVFQAPCPDVSRIPDADLIGVTVVLITCSYRSHEFLRIGYYVNNDYDGMTIMRDPSLGGGEDSMDINISDEEEEEEDDNDDEIDGEEGNDGAVAGNSSANDMMAAATNNENAMGDPVNAEQPPAADANGMMKPATAPQQIVLPRDFDVNKVRRIILDGKPRVTRFAIDWDDEEDVLQQQQQVQAAVGVSVESNNMDMDMDM